MMPRRYQGALPHWQRGQGRLTIFVTCGRFAGGEGMVKMVVAYLSGSPDPHLRGSDMRRSYAWAGGLVLGMGLLAATPAHALITRPTPLRGLIDESRYILTARVEAVDPSRPAMTLTAGAE